MRSIQDSREPGWIVVLAALALMGTGRAPARAKEGARPAPKSLPPRTFACRRVKGKIKLDGKLNEKAWENAPKIKLLQFWKHGAPQSPGFARLLWDEKYLYLGVAFADEDLYADLTKHDANCWENDVCELFLKPSRKRPLSYELHVTPKNNTLDARFRKRGSRRLEYSLKWDSRMKTAVRLAGTLNDPRDKDQGWSAELAIPWKAFRKDVARPKPGERWSFAVCRYDYSVHLAKGKELSASARLRSRNFHRVEDYDALKFEE